MFHNACLLSILIRPYVICEAPTVPVTKQMTRLIPVLFNGFNDAGPVATPFCYGISHDLNDNKTCASAVAAVFYRLFVLVVMSIL